MVSVSFIKRFFPLALFSVLICALLGSCVFSPKEGKKTDAPKPLWEDPVNPGAVINNLQVAFYNRDIDFYEKCLHKDFYYYCPSETDSLPEYYPLSDELYVMKKIFNEAVSFELVANQNTSYVEYGSNIQDIPQGERISTEHPNSIWWYFNYSITMNMTFKTKGEWEVQNEFMTFVMVEEPKGHWSIVRWNETTNLSE
jgi:hypothetical protein